MGQKLETKIVCNKCGYYLDGDDKYCRHCGEAREERRVCRRCGNTVGKEDKYCRICGSPDREEEYCAQEALIEFIYGPPPVDVRHRCLKCGYEWVNWSKFGEIDTEESYCPKCGSSVQKEKINSLY